MTATALGLLDDAGPLARRRAARDAELAALRDADAPPRGRDRRRAPVRPRSPPGSVSSPSGVAVLAALLTGVPAVGAGLLAPVELAVVVLTPLAAFEATSLLPAAAIQVQRSRAAAARVLALLDAPADPPPTDDSRRPAPARRDRPRGRLAGRAAGRRRTSTSTCGPGRSVAIVGPSGSGKTTTLLTLAGLLPRQAGTLTLDGHDVDHLDRHAVAAAVVVGTEDAHVFGTTVLENLRVARGDVTADGGDRRAGARRPRRRGSPASPTVSTPSLGPDARTVSGGERRRLLVARALLSPAPLLLRRRAGRAPRPGHARTPWSRTC